MALPDCFEGIVGLRGRCQPTLNNTPIPETMPGAMIYINDMPDAGIVKMEGMSDVERGSFTQVFDKVYERACLGFQSDIRTFLKDKVKTNWILRNTKTGIPSKLASPDNTIEISDTKGYGVILTVTGSPLMEVVINSIQMALEDDFTGWLRIYDLQTGEQILEQHHHFINDTGPAPPTNIDPRGIVTVNLAKAFGEFLYDSTRVFWIGFNADLDLGLPSLTRISKPGGAGCGAYSCGDHATVQYGTLPLYANLLSDVTFTDEIPGLFFNFGIRCSMVPFICDNADVLKVALRLKTYIELCAEILYNDTLTNRYTLLSSEELRTRIAEFSAQYQQELSNTMENITYKTDRYCWECNQPVLSKYIMP